MNQVQNMKCRRSYPHKEDDNKLKNVLNRKRKKKSPGDKITTKIETEFRFNRDLV